MGTSNGLSVRIWRPWSARVIISAAAASYHIVYLCYLGGAFLNDFQFAWIQMNSLPTPITSRQLLKILHERYSSRQHYQSTASIQGSITHFILVFQAPFTWDNKRDHLIHRSTVMAAPGARSVLGCPFLRIPISEKSHIKEPKPSLN